MLLHIPQLLERVEVEGLLSLAAQGTYEDGRATAGASLHGVKPE